MAHLGSARVTSLKALSAAAYWKEWSCAIPFTSAGWAAGEQELEKPTFPRPCEVNGLTEACWDWQGRRAAKTIKTSKNLRGNIMNHLELCRTRNLTRVST